MSREIRFSVPRSGGPPAGHGSAIRNSWAGWPTTAELTPFIRLAATLRGEPDTSTGYLCDIHAIDAILRRSCVGFADEDAAPTGTRFTAEQFLGSIWSRIAADLPDHAALAQLQLFVSPYVKLMIDETDSTTMQFTEQFEFSAAHRLHSDALTAEQNRELFGKCNNARGHGHNYLIDVTVIGTPDPGSGLVIERERLEAIVKARVLDRFDHKHLNEDTAEFAHLNPTVENIARVIWQRLAGEFRPLRLGGVRVYETAKTWAEYLGDDLL